MPRDRDAGMSNALKCPNPSCPFLFDPTQVPPGAVLTCPRCGMRFMLGPAAAPAAPPPAPPAPTAQPLPPASAETPPSRRRAHSAGDGSPLLVTLGVLTVVGTACAVGFYLVKQAATIPGGRPAAVLEVTDFNFAYDLPGPPWVRDTSPPPAARANLFALKRDNGDARAAFAASKFETHNPQPGDLREALLDRIRRLFEEPDLTEYKGATWAGQPAVKYTFRGMAKGSEATFAGEAYAIGYQGIGYWFLAWAPERDAAARLDEFAELRGRFRLLDHRSNWQATASPFAVHPGEAVDYRIIDTERWWKKPPVEPRDVDQKADLVLRAEYPFKKLDIKPRAELVTYVLDPVGDEPVAAVRALIRDRYAKETTEFGATRLSELTDEPQGDPPAHTELKGIETVRLRADSQRDSNRSKLHVIAAIAVGNRVVGVEARCPWADRPLWERRLIHIAGSLRTGR